MCFKAVPVLLVYLDHLSHVALGAGVFGGIFHFHQYDEEQVVPHVVLLFDVLLESHRLVVELVPLQTCREEKTHIIGVTVCSVCSVRFCKNFFKKWEGDEKK